MIRHMSDLDTDAVAQLWLEANMDAHGFIPESYWRGNLERVRGMLGEAEVYVYEDAGGIEGFIGLTGSRVAGLFVRAGARGRGTGKRLLDLAKLMRDRLELGVYAKNERALRFYEREGFGISGEGVDAETGEAEYEMRWGKED